MPPRGLSGEHVRRPHGVVVRRSGTLRLDSGWWLRTRGGASQGRLDTPTDDRARWTIQHASYHPRPVPACRAADDPGHRRASCYTNSAAFLSPAAILASALTKAQQRGLPVNSFDSSFPSRSQPAEAVNSVPTSCPACRSSSVSTTAKSPDVNSYWRCGECGEVWNVGRRHEARRGSNPWR